MGAGKTQRAARPIPSAPVQSFPFLASDEQRAQKPSLRARCQSMGAAQRRAWTECAAATAATATAAAAAAAASCAVQTTLETFVEGEEALYEFPPAQSLNRGIIQEQAEVAAPRRVRVTEHDQAETGGAPAPAADSDGRVLVTVGMF